jgi:hypothetical protein
MNTLNSPQSSRSSQSSLLRFPRRRAAALALTCGLWLGGAMALPQPAQAGKSTWIRLLSEGNKLWFIDTGSIKKSGSVRYFWSYIQADMPMPEGDSLVAGSAYYLSVDCKKKMYRLRHAQTLDSNGKVIREENYGDSRPMTEINPGTGEAASINYVCARK